MKVRVTMNCSLIEFNDMVHDKNAERLVAVGSFFAAVALAFTSMVISEDHDIAAGVLMMCAQFLTLTATIFGLDYKFTHNGTTKRDKEQQSFEYQERE